MIDLVLEKNNHSETLVISYNIHLPDKLSTRPDLAASVMFAASSLHTLTIWLLVAQTAVIFNYIFL